MKIKLSQYNPIRENKTITKVSTLILKDLTISYLNSDALHVMKEDTMIEIVLRKKMAFEEEREQEKTSCSCCRR